MNCLLPVLLSFWTSPTAVGQDAPAPDAIPTVEAASPSPTVTYSIDDTQSWLYVVVRNDPNTMLSRLGHDHAIRATEFTATVAWNLDDASACDVSFRVPVAKLWPDTPGLRERASLDPEGRVDASKEKQIVDNMLGKRQLQGGTFPEITFSSTTCTGTTGTVQVTGKLAVAGTTKTLTVPMKVAVEDGRFTASGAFDLTHSDLGFEPFAALAGALKNQSTLQFVVDVQGAPNP